MSLYSVSRSLFTIMPRKLYYSAKLILNFAFCYHSFNDCKKFIVLNLLMRKNTFSTKMFSKALNGCTKTSHQTNQYTLNFFIVSTDLL